MARQIRKSRKQLIVKTLVLALASGALYALIFSRQAVITNLFTKGGIYAALPIATAFLFSFVHGAFASNLWTVLGISAHKSEADRVKLAPRKKPARRKDTRPRLYA